MKNGMKIFLSIFSMILLIAALYIFNSPRFVDVFNDTFDPVEIKNQTYHDASTINVDLLPLYFRIQPTSKENGISFYDRSYFNGKRQEVNAFFQDIEDFAKGKVFTDPEANSTLQARRSSLNELYYSYKVRLFDKAGKFMGMKTFNLEKFLEDSVRIRHKFVADINKELGVLLPFDVFFVQAYVQDANLSSEEDYKDYGLFFLTEHIDKLFLQNHQMDDEAALYEADDFSMRSNNLGKSINDDLERRGVNDDDRLEKVLEEVNSTTNIKLVIDQYFDLDNIIDFMAFSILMDKEDPGTEDYYLYSSRRDNKWYIFPSSYRDTLGNYKKVNWKVGIHHFFGNPLFEKVMLDNDLRLDLTTRIETMYQDILAMDLDARIASYHEVVMPMLSRKPDFTGLSQTLSDTENELIQLPSYIDKAYENYQVSLLYPTPIRVSDKDGIVRWTESTSFASAKINYSIKVSKSPSMETIIYEDDEINTLTYDLNSLTPGIYYVQVMVNDDQGYTQYSVDRYTDPFGKDFHSVQQVVIP